MSKDIVNLLRDITPASAYQDVEDLYNHAADEIELLRAQGTQWRKIATNLYEYYHLGIGHSSCVNEYKSYFGSD
jgi:hypothetical protein